MTVYSPTSGDSERPTSERDTENPMTKDRQRRRQTNSTEPSRADTTGAERARTMGEVSHTNPVTGEPFGESQAYGRGRTVVADGGEADVAEDEDDQAGDDVARVKDVDHTPREGAPDASPVYERGGEGEIEDQEGETESVEDEE